MTWDVTMTADPPGEPSPAASGDALLDIRGLRVEYLARGTVIADVLQSIDLALAPGERLAVMGESGSGKTTVGMAIGGFLGAPSARVTADRFSVLGRDVDATRRTRIPRRRDGVSMVFQDAMTSLDPVWTIGSQLEAVLRRVDGLRGRALASAVDGWLRRVGLHDVETIRNRRPYELSGGMRQRVMLALALCGRPRVLIADEPTSALDAGLAREMMQLLSELGAELGASLILISHDIELCTEFSDRSVVMYGGAIVEQNASSRLIAEATHPYTAALVRCIPTLEGADAGRLTTVPALDPGYATTPLSHRGPDGVLGICSQLHPVDGHDPRHLVSCWNPGFPPPTLIGADA